VCDLSSAQVANGAVLVVDTARAEILAWVNAEGCRDTESSQIDAVISPRQPGSTLKPFLYALALSKGWTAATMIDDAPLAEGVGTGLHTYRNYSRTHYGRLPVRDALGNSLNIPAVRTIHFTGTAPFLEFLRTAGFESLTRPAEFYGEGLALGNGEVTLFELVQAYTALASRGVFRPLKLTG
jgi:penicillin-binding protein 1C